MSGYTATALVIITVWALVMGSMAVAHRAPRSPRVRGVAQVAPMITGTDPRGITWAAMITGPDTARLIRNGQPWVDALGRDTLTRLTARYAITWAAQ